MAAGSGSGLLRVPGTLVKSPSDVSDPSNDYGGTALGVVRDVVLLAVLPFFEVVAEEYGPAEWVELYELGARFELRCSLRVHDDDAFAAVFPNTFSGANQSRVGVQHPGTTLPGARVSDRAASILYAADDARLPSVYMRSALPVSATRVEAALGHDADALWACRFVGRRDPSTEDKSFQLQLVEDITL